MIYSWNTYGPVKLKAFYALEKSQQEIQLQKVLIQRQGKELLTHIHFEWLEIQIHLLGEKNVNLMTLKKIILHTE